MKDETLNTLTEFASTIEFSDIPAVVFDRAVDILVDSLGCALGGSACLAAKVAFDLRSSPASSVGRVIGWPIRVNPELASFWNTAMIRYLDFNDSSPPPAGGHPSDMIGAIVAASAMTECSGEEALKAIVVAYEVYTRVSSAVQRPERTVDMGYAATVGAAAGCAALLNLTADQTRHALAMAASSGLPLRSTRAGQLSHYKGLASAVAMRNAVFFALLAREGITGPESPFDGRHGVVELLDKTSGILGIEPFDHWNTLRIRLKYWPVAYNMQAAVWAAIELREHAEVDKISQLIIHADPRSWLVSGSEPAKWDPTTRETANASLPYAVSHALVHGRLDVNSFDDTALRDESTRALMRKVQVERDEAAGPGTVRVEMQTMQGTTYTSSISGPKGHETNPFDRSDLAAKFAGLAHPTLGGNTQAALQGVLATRSTASFEDVLDLFDFVHE